MILNTYKTHTVDDLIEILQTFKRKNDGNTEVHLSDFEFNDRHRKFEISFVEGEKELFIFYERHDEEW